MFNNTFSQDIKNLVVISASEGEQLINSGDRVTIFVGRSSCPYCQRFAKKLAVVADNTLEKIYFINSENISPELNQFRDKYGVVTVPGFIHAYDNHVTVKCDSGMTIEEIQQMMK